MNIALIVAMSENNVIGNQQGIPWHLPDDFKHFKTLTLQKPIIMGRQTYLSIGKALPGRRNIVLTRDPNFDVSDARCEKNTIEGIDIVHSIDEALKLSETLISRYPTSENEVFIIGGAQIYQQFMPLARKLYITRVHANIKGDTVFSAWNENEWALKNKQTHAIDDRHAFAFSFLEYEKITQP